MASQVKTAQKHWRLIGRKPHHGFCMPLFALHSQKSGGIGEYLDLIPMIRWCAKLGLDTIQLLPLNDTGEEISPYSPISVMALNPIHLSLNGPYKETQLLQKLNKLQHIAYEDVRELKEKILQKEFQKNYPKVSRSPAYRNFIAEQSWLTAYAQYKGQPDYQMFLQYLCYQQLMQVRRAADRHGVLLKGDIPILLAPESCDVKRHPELFDTTLCAGAPPDRYIPQGQNWGFPLYRWDQEWNAILEWWHRRLQYHQHFFHLYRVDHVVGLFRIWAIPKGKKAVDGHFLPHSRKAWVPQGEAILRDFLRHTEMLPIAEDLGTVPAAVRACLSDLQIPGTKVMRWERRSIHGAYIPLDAYPPLSMTTVSTHDTETLQQWWSKRPEEARPFAKLLKLTYRSTLQPDQRMSILKASHQTTSYFHINLLQEYFPLIQGFAWEKPDDERINRPDRSSRKNWRYRYRRSIEEITSSASLKNIIKEAVWKP